MRYLISYDAGSQRTDRLRKELADLHADPCHRWAWMLETRLTATELIRQFKSFLEDADSLLVVDVTAREVVIAHGPDRTLLADAEVLEAIPPHGVGVPLVPVPDAAVPDVPLSVIDAPIAPVTVVEVPSAPLAAEPGEPTA